MPESYDNLKFYQEVGFVDHTAGPLLKGRLCEMPRVFADNTEARLHTQRLTAENGELVYACSLVGLNKRLASIADTLSDKLSAKTNKLFLNGLRAQVEKSKGPRETLFRDAGDMAIRCFNNEQDACVFVSRICKIGKTPVYAKVAVCGRGGSLSSTLRVLGLDQSQAAHSLATLVK